MLEEKGSIYLVVDPTKKVKLQLDAEASAVRELLGCKVRVEGVSSLGRLRVDRFEVLDAGYGTVPHVGVLQRQGSTLRMHDTNSGALLELVGPLVAEIEHREGATVLVNGVIVGPHQVRVMSYRILLQPEGGNVPTPG